MLSSPYTSNRGITDAPNQRYADLVAYYTPQPQRVGGGGQQAQQAASSPTGLSMADFSQFFAPLGGGAAAGPSRTNPTQRTPGNPNSRYTPKARGGGGGVRAPQAPQQDWRAILGSQYPGANGAVPPATTNPQTPVPQQPGQDIASLLAQVNAGITNGQLSNDVIAKHLAQLTGDASRTYTAPASVGGQTSAGNDGSSYFGQLMQRDLGRAASDFSRTASQQQAEMSNDFQQGRSAANMNLAALLQATNRENVTHDVAMRNAMINNLAAMMGGLF